MYLFVYACEHWSSFAWYMLDLICAYFLPRSLGVIFSRVFLWLHFQEPQMAGVLCVCLAAMYNCMCVCMSRKPRREATSFSNNGGEIKITTAPIFGRKFHQAAPPSMTTLVKFAAYEHLKVTWSCARSSHQALTRCNIPCLSFQIQTLKGNENKLKYKAKRLNVL